MSDRDHKLMSCVRMTECQDEFDCAEEDLCETVDSSLFIDNPTPAAYRRVTSRKSPHLSCFFNHYPVNVCLDTGSESSLISERFARSSGMPILPQTVRQGAVQADSASKLNVIGEVKNVTLHRGPHVFNIDALVTTNDIGDIIAGEPFLESNDIAIRSSKKQIIIKGSEIVPYSTYNNNL